MIRRQNRLSWLLLLLAGVLYVALFYPSLAEIVAIWSRSQTYSHGFLVAPVSLYLAWRRRRELAHVALHPCPACLLPLALVAAGWYLAESVSIQALEHLFTYAFVPLLVLLLLGRDAGRLLAFPLFYLVFAVPLGDFLVPHLVDLTGTVTVAALKAIGMPVFKNGHLISIPSGNFKVEQACSGIRYLIASLAVGTLFAYLSFRSTRKRLLFVLLAAVVPLIANSMRAFGIIMLAHWSDMRIAVGVDHVIYGWLFFGVVMFVLFLIGARMRGPEDLSEGPVQPAVAPVRARPASPAGTLLTALLAAGILIMPVAAVERQAQQIAGGSCVQPVVAGPESPDWRPEAATGADWKPRFGGRGSQHRVRYAGPAGVVDLFWVSYPLQGPAELIGSGNRFFVRPWTLVGHERRRVLAGGRAVEVTELRLANRLGDQRLLWYWYELGGRTAAGPLEGKWLEFLARSEGTHCSALAVVLSAPYQLYPDEARRGLADFLQHLDVHTEPGVPIQRDGRDGR